MRAALIDFETTGLLDARPRLDTQPYITQIGCVILDDELNEIDAYSTLINPDIDAAKWDAKAIETTGIKPEDVLNAPTLFLAINDFAPRVLGCDVWAGFNCGFDQRVLWWELQRIGHDCSFPWPIRTTDVMTLAKRKLEIQGRQGMKTPNLGEAYLHLVGKKLEGAHDALVDVRGTAEVWRKCK